MINILVMCDMYACLICHMLYFTGEEICTYSVK
jgi:hypothetical protein